MPVTGVPEFTDLALRFAYGKDSAALKEGRIAGVQVYTVPQKRSLEKSP